MVDNGVGLMHPPPVIRRDRGCTCCCKFMLAYSSRYTALVSGQPACIRVAAYEGYQARFHDTRFCECDTANPQATFAITVSQTKLWEPVQGWARPVPFRDSDSLMLAVYTDNEGEAFETWQKAEELLISGNLEVIFNAGAAGGDGEAPKV